MGRKTMSFLVAFALGVPSLGCAAVKSWKDLSLPEKMALQESENRMGVYDRALPALETALKNKKITHQEFGYQQHDIGAFIGEEAKYQNEILTKDTSFPEDAREVLQNVAKYSIEVPGYIVLIAAKAVLHPGASYSVSP